MPRRLEARILEPTLTQDRLAWAMLQVMGLDGW